jgi:hypothetical protein
MDKLDLIDWQKFTQNPSTTLSVEDVKLISELHAKYFKHSYHTPCSCNPKTIVGWIKDLNNIYEGLD